MNNYKLLPRLSGENSHKLREDVLAKGKIGPVFNETLVADYYADSKAFPGTGGEQISLEELLNIREAVVGLMPELPAPESAGFTSSFDLLVGEALYSRTLYSPGEMGTSGVWDFLTL